MAQQMGQQMAQQMVQQMAQHICQLLQNPLNRRPSSVESGFAPGFFIRFLP